MKRVPVVFLAPALALLFSSCGHTAQDAVPPAAIAEAPPPFSDPAPRSRDADNAGRFLAGLPAAGETPFAELVKDPAWAKHRAELDRAWANPETRTMPSMREFSKKELGGALAKTIAFYPFSGPDTLMATIFLPHSPTYIMIGLEPAGTLPTPAQFPREDLAKRLALVRDTVSSELVRSFFITKEMDRDFRGGVNDGLLAPILHLLVRTGHTILGYRYVRIDNQGAIVERTLAYKSTAKDWNLGVQVDFSTDEDKSVHQLFYFSVNLADDRLGKNQPPLDLIGRLKGMTTLFKATSYMMHRPEFGVIRSQVLQNSDAILQDDSGVPYHFFDAATWKVQLFGDYDRPYGSFRWLEQPDLRKAYNSPGTKPLGFRIGYGFSRIPSNMLLAIRHTAK